MLQSIEHFWCKIEHSNIERRTLNVLTSELCEPPDLTL